MRCSKIQEEQSTVPLWSLWYLWAIWFLLLKFGIYIEMDVEVELFFCQAVVRSASVEAALAYAGLWWRFLLTAPAWLRVCSTIAAWGEYSVGGSIQQPSLHAVQVLT